MIFWLFVAAIGVLFLISAILLWTALTIDDKATRAHREWDDVQDDQ